MRENPQLFVAIIASILFVIDIYAFKGVRLLISDINNDWVRRGIIVFYWSISLFIFGFIVYIIANFYGIRNPNQEAYFLVFSTFLFLTFVPKLFFVIFHLIEDISFVIYYVGNKLFSNPDKGVIDGERINRIQFITKTGALLALIPFSSLAYGILKGKYDFRVLSEKLLFSNLPKAFHGLKIVQISDLHIGSFNNNYGAVKKGIAMVNDLNPDIIFFTGDLVNNFAEETDGWEEILGSLKAKYGKYSILGNHDYSDYIPWDSLELKKKNLEKLINFHKKIGFRLLLNESEKIKIDNDYFTIIGIENWGKGNFSKYGDLNKAMQEVDNGSFKILLSHDPSHWDAQVLSQTNIDLTLSGHTHGMQFGISLGSFKYSPSQHRYPRWGGLYSEANQFLYVNRGFGFIGFPGRVGMPPEITLLELESQQA